MSNIRNEQKKVDMPEPFEEIKRDLHNGDFRKLGSLRQESAHDFQDKPKLVESFHFFIGQPTIDPKDTAQWQRLQIAVLRFVAHVLEQISSKLETAVCQPGKQEEPVIQW